MVFASGLLVEVLSALDLVRVMLARAFLTHCAACTVCCSNNTPVHYSRPPWERLHLGGKRVCGCVNSRGALCRRHRLNIWPQTSPHSIHPHFRAWIGAVRGGTEHEHVYCRERYDLSISTWTILTVIILDCV